ncbi:unnamed protein product [Caenorhabditis brenneri]
MHIAAHVPSYGRLHLYRLMGNVGADNICYTGKPEKYKSQNTIFTFRHQLRGV